MLAMGVSMVVTSTYRLYMKMYNLGVIFILYELADATIYSKWNMSKVKKGSLNAND